MAILGTITKQPREKVDFDISYATVLANRSDTMVSGIVEVVPAGLTLSPVTFAGDTAKVTVSAGTDATTYKVTVLATTTAGLIYEDEVTVIVEEA